MKLHELHVHQVGPGVVGQRVAVAGVFPTVAGDLVGAAHAAGGQHDRLGAEHPETPALAVVAEGADNPPVVLQQRDDGALHVHLDTLVNAVVLQRADHFQPGAVADVRQPGVFVAAEVALQDAPVLGTVEQRAPRFELAHALRGFLGMQLRHARVVHVLAAAHGVGEMHLPVVALVHVGQGRGDAALGHHRVGLAEQRFADQADGQPGGRRLDGRPQAGAAGADDQYVVLMRFVVEHYRILKSVHIPMAHRRTYRSENPTHTRLVQAHSMCLRFRQLTQLYAFSRAGDADRRSRMPPTRWRMEWHPERVAAQQHHVDRQHQGADAEAEGRDPGRLVGEPQGVPHVVGEENREEQRHVEKITVDVVQNQREGILAPVAVARLAHRAGHRVGPERLVVGAAVVVAGEAKAERRPQDQKGRRPRQRRRATRTGLGPNQLCDDSPNISGEYMGDRYGPTA